MITSQRCRTDVSAVSVLSACKLTSEPRLEKSIQAALCQIPGRTPEGFHNPYSVHGCTNGYTLSVLVRTYPLFCVGRFCCVTPIPDNRSPIPISRSPPQFRLMDHVKKGVKLDSVIQPGSQIVSHNTDNPGRRTHPHIPPRACPP